MTELAIKRALNDNTLKRGLIIDGKVYALHITRNREVLITDSTDYSKVYAVLSLELFNVIEQGENAK